MGIALGLVAESDPAAAIDTDFAGSGFVGLDFAGFDLVHLVMHTEHSAGPNPRIAVLILKFAVESSWLDNLRTEYSLVVGSRDFGYEKVCSCCPGRSAYSRLVQHQVQPVRPERQTRQSP